MTKLITAQTVNEAACLLHNDGRSVVGGDNKSIVLLHYARDRKHDIQGEDGTDGSGEEYSIQQLPELPQEVSILRETFPGDINGIRVVASRECLKTPALGILGAVARAMPWPEDSSIIHPSSASSVSAIPDRPSPSTILHTTRIPADILDDLDRNDLFRTGISLRAGFKPEKFMTLFVAIPYLGPGNEVSTIEVSTTESLTLDQYKFRGTRMHGVSSHDKEILVHQAWFCILDDTTIVLFRSSHDKSEMRAPLFPYQGRECGVRALIQMISNTFTPSERVPLKKFREKVYLQELELRNHILKRTEKTTLTDGEANTNEVTKSAEETSFEEKKAAFDQSITNIAAIVSVVESQLQILNDLQEILQHPSDKFEGELGPSSNAVKIPFMVGEEEMHLALLTIGAVIKEREVSQKKLGNWLKEMRHSQLLLSQGSQACAVQDALVKQGQTITVFTLLTAVFLPLGFLAAYFAINFKELDTTRSQFWIVSGTVTACFFSAMSLFLYAQDDTIKDWILNGLRGITKKVTRKKGDPDLERVSHIQGEKPEENVSHTELISRRPSEPAPAPPPSNQRRSTLAPPPSNH